MDHAAAANLPIAYLCGNAPFPQEFFNKLYPKQQWAHRKEFGLHFLIASGMPDATLIGACLQKNPRAALLCDPQNDNITPLHLAAMKVNRAAAEKILLENKESLSVQTASGFSPLHAAALTSDELYDLFVRNGADSELKTKTGMRAKDLRLLSGRAVDIQSADSLFYQESPAQEAVLLSSDPCLKTKVFGAGFFHSDTSIFDAPFFPELCMQNPASHPFYLEAYQQYVRNRPKLVIGPSEQLKQLELRTIEKIPAGCMVTEYTGKKCKIPSIKRFADNFTEQTMQESAYRGFNKIDAKFVGNESRFANCGFPNAFILTAGIDGIERSLVLAIEDIEPGEPILLDYGIDMLYLIYGIQFILGKERMKSFYKKHGKDLLATLEHAQKQCGVQSTMQAVIACTALESWFGFPFQNPTALLYLHFNKCVDYIKLCKDMKKSSLKFIQEDLTSRVNYQHILHIVGILKKIKNRPKKGEWDNVAAWVLARLEKIPLTHIIKGLDLFAKGKQEKEVNQILEHYNWLEDEDHPFSYHRRVDHLVDIYSQQPKEEIIPSLQATLKEENREFESYRMTQEIIQRLRSGKK